MISIILKKLTRPFGLIKIAKVSITSSISITAVQSRMHIYSLNLNFTNRCAKQPRNPVFSVFRAFRHLDSLEN